MAAYSLKRTVAVADKAGEPLVTLSRGTPLGEIPDHMLEQLCAEHFVDADGAPMEAKGPAALGRIARDTEAAPEGEG